jgi:hypothetical protein
VTGPVAPADSPLLSETIHRAWVDLRHGWRPIGVASLIALLPAAVAQGALESLAAELDDQTLVLLVLSAAAAGAGLLGYYFLSGVVAQIVLARRAGDAYPGLAEIARSLPWARLLAVDLIVTAGTMIGLELLVVPGVVLATWFALAPALVETRHAEPLAALRRSRELVRGRFWRVLALVVWPIAVVYAGSAIIGALIDPSVAPGTLAYGIVSLLFGLAVKPFTAVVTVELALALDRASP